MIERTDFRKGSLLIYQENGLKIIDLVGILVPSFISMNLWLFGIMVKKLSLLC